MYFCNNLPILFLGAFYFFISTEATATITVNNGSARKRRDLDPPPYTLAEPIVPSRVMYPSSTEYPQEITEEDLENLAAEELAGSIPPVYIPESSMEDAMSIYDAQLPVINDSPSPPNEPLSSDDPILLAST